MTPGFDCKIIVPLEVFDKYVNHPNHNDYRYFYESRMSNVGKKSNYKKFAKRMRKAIKYLPEEFEVVVRVDKTKEKKND